MKGENIIIFSSDDWASGLKTSKYHIARGLARHNRVLFINSVGLRAPSATGRDLKRAVHKLASCLRGAIAVPEGLHVYTPVVVPWRRGSPLVASINATILRIAIRTLMWKLGLSRPIVFAFLPTFNAVIGTLGEKAIVYYCIDDMRGYAGIDAAWFDREEKRLLGRANCAISSARQLAEEFREQGYRSHYVPHGVDWMAFRAAIVDDLPLPEDLANIPEPRLGFYGFLSDEWLDYELVARMAREHPEWHIVLIGRPRAGMDESQLRASANIHYLGLKPFTELPAYTRHFALGLIPFRVNRLTMHSNPLKLLEYLAGGLPVVSTDIPEVRGYREFVHIARSHEEYIALCARAIAEDTPSQRLQRSEFARANSWEARLKLISDIVDSEIS
jgi:glycosyltransferase involved in cell wall biosynthesis